MSLTLDKANQILAEKKAKIIPQNIKKGVNIFGVNGTLDALASIKHFNTFEEMYADANSENDDMAIVYEHQILDVTPNSILTKVLFPDIITLSEPITSTTSTNYSFSDSSTSYVAIVSKTSMSIFNMSYLTTILSYSSDDGITYSNGYTEPGYVYTFNNLLGSNIPAIISPFFKNEVYMFEGLFQYRPNGRRDLLRTISVTDVSYDATNDKMVWNGEFNGPSFDAYKLKTLERQIHKNRPSTIETSSSACGYYFVTDEDNNPYLCAVRDSNAMYQQASRSYAPSPMYDTNNNNNVVGSTYTKNMSSTSYNLWVYKLDLENMTYEEPIIYTPTGNGEKCVWNFKPSIIAMLNTYEYDDVDDYYMPYIYTYALGADTDETNKSYSTSISAIFHENGYGPAPSQLNIDDPNQLLPGRMTIGKYGAIEGDGTIYDNLNWNEVLSKILNLTPNDTINSTKCYSSLPTKLTTDIKIKDKVHHLKRRTNPTDVGYIIGDITYDIDGTVKPTLLYDSIKKFIVNAKHNMIISAQIKSGDTSEFHLVFEDITTKTILHDTVYSFTGGYNYDNFELTNNAVYLRAYNSYNSNYYWEIYAYDLDTFTKTTVLNSTLTSSSGYTIRSMFEKFGDRFLITGRLWKASNSTSAYAQINIYDDVSKQVINVINSEAATCSSSTSSADLYARTLYCGNCTYILCTWGDGRYTKLYKLSITDTSSTISLMTSAAGDKSGDVMNAGYTTSYNGSDFDPNYLYWEDCRISKSNLTDFVTSSTLTVVDEQGNIIKTKRAPYEKINCNGDTYICCTDYMYRMKSYSFADKVFTVVCDRIYSMPTGLYVYCKNDEGGIDGNLMQILHPYMKAIDDNSYIVHFRNNKIEGDIKCTCVVPSSSLDCDYNLIYTGTDAYVTIPYMTMDERYDGTITPEKYTECDNLASIALGETQLVDGPEINATLSITNNETVKVEDNTLIIE